MMPKRLSGSFPGANITTTTTASPISKKKKKNAILETPKKAESVINNTTALSNVPTQNRFGFSDFTGYTTNFQGYKCRFLKREAQILLKLSVNAMAFTQFESLGLFEMNEVERADYLNMMDQLLQEWRDFDVTVKKSILLFFWQWRKNQAAFPKIVVRMFLL